MGLLTTNNTTTQESKLKVKIIRFDKIETWPDDVLKEQRDLSIMQMSDEYTEMIENEIKKRAV